MSDKYQEFMMNLLIVIIVLLINLYLFKLLVDTGHELSGWIYYPVAIYLLVSILQSINMTYVVL